MKESSVIKGNIFNSLDLVHVVESLKHAVTEGNRSVALKKALADTFDIIKKVTRSEGVRLYSVVDERFITLEYDNKWERPGGTQRWKLVFVADQCMCLPINALDVGCFSVLELFRGTEDEPFSKIEKKIVSTIVGWLGRNVSPAILNRKKKEEEKLDLLTERTNIFLKLHKTFLRFCLRSEIDGDSKDNVIEALMVNMNELLDAERVRFLLFHEDTNKDFMWPPELCECYEAQMRSNKCFNWKNKKLIEFNPEIDIAWHAINEKNVINVDVRTSDTKLKHNIDVGYGYCVSSMLSFPIYGKSKVVGAVNVINKLSKPYFTRLDEEICECIAEYFAFILTCNGLLTKNSQKELEFEIALDMFSNRLEPTQESINLLVNSDFFNILPDGFLRFNWYPLGHEDHLEQLAYYMMKDMIDEVFAPNREILAKLILFTKNLYSPTCFHNFEHAVNVLHCIYIIFKRNVNVFRQIEITALAVTALCHDAGRSGYRRKGVSSSEDIYQKLYDVVQGYSNVCERIVGIVKDVEMFKHLPNEEYQEMVNLVMHYATGTDLCVSFEKRLRVKGLMERDEFDLKVPLHRSQCMVLVMSAADLSGQTKPIDIAMMLNRRFYEEFHERGDLEKSNGLWPTERMNRDLCDDIHEQQLFYLTKIAKPVYEIIAMVLPNTKPLLNGIEAVISAEESDFAELASHLDKTRAN